MVKNLRLLREERGFSQQRLAEMLDVSQQAVFKYEKTSNGDKRKKRKAWNGCTYGEGNFSHKPLAQASRRRSGEYGRFD